jgi:hypothetical protein
VLRVAGGRWWSVAAENVSAAGQAFAFRKRGEMKIKKLPNRVYSDSFGSFRIISDFSGAGPIGSTEGGWELLSWKR